MFFSELFASAILLFIGCLGCVDNSPFFTPTHVTISLSFAFGIMIGIVTFSTSSGGLISPILTLCALIYKRFNWIVSDVV